VRDSSQAIVSLARTSLSPTRKTNLTLENRFGGDGTYAFLQLAAGVYKLASPPLDSKPTRRQLSIVKVNDQLQVDVTQAKQTIRNAMCKASRKRTRRTPGRGAAPTTGAPKAPAPGPNRPPCHRRLHAASYRRHCCPARRRRNGRNGRPSASPSDPATPMVSAGVRFDEIWIREPATGSSPGRAAVQGWPRCPHR